MARAMAFPIPLDAPVHMTRDLCLLPAGVVGGGSFMVMIVIVIVIVIVILPL